jgi:hypothetical protein
METIGVRHGGVKHSLHILLRSLIDYAGLFPPAGLRMADAVVNYARYKNGANAWALGRFILPAARLDEFESCFAPDRKPWHLSVLVGQNPAEDLARVAEFNARHRHAAVIDALEAKAANPSAISELRAQVPESILLYFEVANGEDPRPLIQAVAAAHSRAKIRTGGLTQEMFPSEQQIVSFLAACVEANVAFKATAGLHHPLRCLKPLTYEKDAPRGTMHGFLNLFLAVAFLLDGLPSEQLQQLLLDDDAGHFDFEDGLVTWRGRRLKQARLLESRALAASFGSCSFEEPMEDLALLSLL